MPDEPPQIDLKPSHPRYPNGAPKGYGKVHTGQMVFSLAVAVIGLIFVFVRRAEFSDHILFGVTAMLAFGGGVVLTILLRRFI